MRKHLLELPYDRVLVSEFSSQIVEHILEIFLAFAWLSVDVVNVDNEPFYSTKTMTFSVWFFLDEVATTDPNQVLTSAVGLALLCSG